MSWIKKLWRGEEKLWKVFWVYGGAAELLILAFGYSIQSMSAASTAIGAGWQLLITSAYFVLIELVAVCWGICVWKCAKNTRYKICRYSAMLITGSILLVFTYATPSRVIAYAVVGIDTVNHPVEATRCYNQLSETINPKPASFIHEQYKAFHACVQKAAVQLAQIF